MVNLKSFNDDVKVKLTTFIHINVGAAFISNPTSN